MPNRFAFLGLVVALAVPAAATVAEVASAPAAGAVSTSPTWSVTNSGWDRSSSPTIADVNGDGTPEIVIGHQDGMLRVLSGASGNNIAHWPQQAGAAIDSTPAVADLNKNGHKEIIVGVGSTWKPNQQGGLLIFNADGSRHCTFRTRDTGNVWANSPNADGYSEPVFSSPAIGDVNGDGYPDVVFGAFDLHVYAVDRNCNKIIDYNVEDSVWSSPALYDIDGDGRMEIFIGGDQSAGGYINWAGGEFRALKWSPFAPGGAYELWKHQVDDTIWSSPAIGDINGDGRVEVVVGTGFYYNHGDSHRVFAWNAFNGAPLSGWPVTTGGWTMPSPALGDVTGDGIPEVAVGSSDGVLRVYRGSGAQLWANHLTFNNTSPGGPVSSPIIADLDGDGHNDVGAGNDFGFFVVRGSTGQVMTQVNRWLSHESAAAVGNFGGAGWKLIVDGFNTPNHTNTLQAFSMPAPGIAAPWPEFRHDASHHAGPVGTHLLAPGYCSRSSIKHNPVASSSHGYWVAGADGAVYALKGAPSKGSARGKVFGRVVGIGATRSGGGYYLLDAAGRIFPFGDAVSRGSMAGHALNAPIIALAPTATGQGYYLLGRDGGVFTFGDAHFYGSLGAKHLNAPIISMTATRSGKGYWLLGADGGVFTFGDARFHGSTGGRRLAAPVISMAAAPSGSGYWLIARDGGVFSFDVPFYGSIPGLGLCSAPAGMQIRPTLTGHGYFVLGANGTVWPFGDAAGGQSAPPLTMLNYAVDMAVRP